MIEQLFGSKTRVKLLQLFYSNPNRSFYVREITRKVDEQINSVRRELSNLLNVGIITSENNNNKLYYELNHGFEHYDAFLSIFGKATPAAKKAKTKVADTGEADELKALGKVELAFYTGWFTRDESAGIDMLFVGDINSRALDKYIAELEAKEGRDIRYSAMSLADFNYRRQVHDRFISQVLEAKRQIITDKENIIENEE
jgi:hypothetical protein